MLTATQFFKATAIPELFQGQGMPEFGLPNQSLFALCGYYNVAASSLGIEETCDTWKLLHLMKFHIEDKI